MSSAGSPEPAVGAARTPHSISSSSHPTLTHRARRGEGEEVDARRDDGARGRHPIPAPETSAGGGGGHSGSAVRRGRGAAAAPGGGDRGRVRGAAIAPHSRPTARPAMLLLPPVRAACAGHALPAAGRPKAPCAGRVGSPRPIARRTPPRRVPPPPTAAPAAAAAAVPPSWGSATPGVVLVADVGGTNCRFVLSSGGGDELVHVVGSGRGGGREAASGREPSTLDARPVSALARSTPPRTTPPLPLPSPPWPPSPDSPPPPPLRSRSRGPCPGTPRASPTSLGRWTATP